MKKILILINNYFSSEEINQFTLHVDKLKSGKEVEVVIIINDNTGEYCQDIAPQFITVHIVTAPYNLGYLGGCENGYNYWVNTLKNNIPDWVMISNTDLILPDNFFSILRVTNPRIGVLSPAVINSNGKIENPHIINKIKKNTIKNYITIFSNSFLGNLYLFLSEKKKIIKIFSRQEKEVLDNKIYAAHGSIFILTKCFFSAGGEFNGCPFLYSEEIFIAEQVCQLDLLSIIIPEIIVKHNAHSATNSLSINKKRKLLLDSYKIIYHRFFKG